MPLRIASLSELVDRGAIQLTRGKVISKKDMEALPGPNPVYSSAKEGDGKFGAYGRYMFDEELITWSVDGGGRLFHRHKHKFSVTNVGGILRILDTTLLDYRYLYYLLTLRHSESRFDWVKKAHPSVIKKLYVNLPIPSLTEQRRIVAVLDETFEGIRIATANAEKNLANAGEVFFAERNRVFATLPTPARRPLGEICEILDSRRKPITKADRVPGPHPYYGATGIVDHVADYLFDEPLVLLGEDGAKWGRNERSSFPIEGRCWVNNHAHVLRPNRDVLLDRWLIHYLNDTDLMPFISGVTVPKLNQGRMREILVPTPPIGAQEQLSDVLDTIEGATLRLRDRYEAKASGLSDLKQSILSRAFSGQLSATKGLAA